MTTVHPSTAPTPASEDSDPPSKAVDAARGTALNLAGSILGAIVGFVTIGVVTNRWGRDGAGLFFAATALFTLAANGARMGSEAGLTYFVARLRADGRPASVPSVVRTAVGVTAAVSVVVAVVGLVVAPDLARLVTDDPLARPEARSMIRVLALAVPTFALSQAMFGASRGFGTMRPSVVAGQIVRPATQLALVAGVAATTDSLVALAGAWALSSSLTLVSIGVWLRGRLARVRPDEPARALDPAGDPSRALDRAGDPSRALDPAGDPGRALDGAGDRRRYLRFAVGRAGADLVSAGLERLDVILVAAVLGQSGAGLYGAAGRLILAGQLLMIAASQSTAPLLTASFSAGRDDEARHLLRTVTAWNVTLLWPLFIVLGFGSRTALSIFGSEFTDGAPLVVVLSLSMLVIVAMGGGDVLLTSTGDSMASLINHVIALVVMVGTAAVLLPTVGVVGAAWAWAASRLTLRTLASVRVWRTRDVHAIGRPVALAAAAAATAYVPIGVAARLGLGSGPLALAVTVTVGLVVHLVLLVRLRRELELDRFVAVVARRRPHPNGGS